MIIVKIYLGFSLELLQTVQGQFIFRQFLSLAYTSQGLQAPSYVVGANYRVLIYCTCHFQSSSLYFSFFCLLVSSVSNFCPDTRRAVVVTFFRLTCSVVLWGGRNTANKYHWRVWAVLTVFQLHWVCPHSRRACYPSLHCSGCRLLCRNCLMWALGCMHSPGLSHSGSGFWVFHKGADLVGPVFCACPRSKQLR